MLINSDLDLTPLLGPSSDSASPLMIRRSAIAALHPARSLGPDNSFYLENLTGRFLIDRDSIRYDAKADPCLLPFGIVGRGLGSHCALRGDLVLHASAVVLRQAKSHDQALVFAAPSGEGKSTSAAYFALRGHPLIAEDFVALRFDDEGVPYTHGGFLASKLSSQAAALLGLSDPVLACDKFDDAYYPVPAAGPERLDLGGIILLGRDLGPTRRLKGTEALTRLLAVTFAPYLLELMKLEAQNFAAMTRLAGRVPVWHVDVKHSQEGFDELAALIAQWPDS